MSNRGESTMSIWANARRNDAHDESFVQVFYPDCLRAAQPRAAVLLVEPKSAPTLKITELTTLVSRVRLTHDLGGPRREVRDARNYAPLRKNQRNQNARG